MDKKEKRKPTGNYTVGFAAPPAQYHFPKGKSGYPQGRPKKPKPDMAWARQAKEHGGIKRKANNQLQQMMQQLRGGDEPTPETSLIIKPGTKLIREYQGEKHEVITTAEGFRYKGKAFNSLSSIAREITGTRWNGKVFFGVKKL